MFEKLLKKWSKTSYMTQLKLMKCSLAFGQVKVQQMQFLFLGSFKRTISQNTENCTWHLLILKRFLIQYVKRSCCRALCVIGVLEWLVKLVQAMYVGSRNRTCVNIFFSQEIVVKVGCTRDQY